MTDEALYGVDERIVHDIKSKMEWTRNPKFFTKMKISPSAAVKMQTHGQSGVDKGVNKSGKPIEVMGLLLGHLDSEESGCIIISDAQPLPVEGFETRVIADDESTINYMIELGEINELTRKERFCGWYHTHPFDVDINSNCFLSTTDISTQLQWQRSEDPHGNPWFAVVIDPLRTLAKNCPEMKAFRVYPPDYSPPPNETPDGSYVTDDKLRIEKWGAGWARYYELEVTYFMSTLACQTLGIFKKSVLWQSPFALAPYFDTGVCRLLSVAVLASHTRTVLRTRPCRAARSRRGPTGAASGEDFSGARDGKRCARGSVPVRPAPGARRFILVLDCD